MLGNMVEHIYNQECVHAYDSNCEEIQRTATQQYESRLECAITLLEMGIKEESVLRMYRVDKIDIEYYRPVLEKKKQDFLIEFEKRRK